MKSIYAYLTIIRTNEVELDAAVSERLSSGWKLVGGLSMCVRHDHGFDSPRVTVLYGQALMRRVKPHRDEVAETPSSQNQDIY